MVLLVPSTFSHVVQKNKRIEEINVYTSNGQEKILCLSAPSHTPLAYYFTLV